MQPPQCVVLVFGLTHAPLQLISGSVQLTVHIPLEHTSFIWHGAALLHDVPQVIGLLRSVHVPLQLTVPIGQQMPFALYSVSVSQHRPAVHVSVLAQGALQAPQCASSVCVFVQLVPVQLSNPGPQQMPLSHVAGLVHAALHAPQCELLVSGSTQTPPQLRKPIVQHLPLTFSCPAGQHRPSSHVLPLAHIMPPMPAQPPQ